MEIETGQTFVQSQESVAHANDTATKLAEVFPTNRTYSPSNATNESSLHQAKTSYIFRHLPYFVGDSMLGFWRFGLGFLTLRSWLWLIRFHHDKANRGGSNKPNSFREVRASPSLPSLDLRLSFRSINKTIRRT